MKKMYLIFGTFFVLIQTFSQTDEVLTNESVMFLHELELPSSVIISKIQNSKTDFDVSTSGLVKLSKSGVSSEIISEMMKISNEKKSEMANQKDMNDPKTKRSSGIYYYNPRNSEKPIRRVDPTVISSETSGGAGAAIAQAYTYGLATSKSKSSIASSNSRLQIPESSPSFYFYFESSSNNMGGDNWFFATATSPNEFVLVKLNVKKDKREMVTGSGNYYGQSSGIPEKYKIHFDYSEESEGVYRVRFPKPLEAGEYCFLYASSVPSMYTNNKVFDFGISVGYDK